jgi:predicted Holliday junction resolvase-like endonuclease
MTSPLIIPLAAFAMAILIVAIVSLVKVRDKELEIQHTLRREEMEHQLKKRELELQLQRHRTGS